ncbi:hypothetical protein GOP47_0023588 [Adiantum capillus-veneris]|uniref:Uncharacterized protein n=1 Tax=Adiantum capillus-veneris TaxID=13818 RepID=A0A9D4U4Y1_ADICA|nr:hypothetical protein GOP47_0023588 [Adiantum capillus-veneris]
MLILHYLKHCGSPKRAVFTVGTRESASPTYSSSPSSSSSPALQYPMAAAVLLTPLYSPIPRARRPSASR